VLIGLLGYAGAGKDTVASLLPGFERRAFADKLRELALKIDPVVSFGERVGAKYLSEAVNENGWDTAKRCLPGVRRLLQNLGQGAREVLWDTIWIDAVLPGNVVEYDALDIAVTDVRYRNEAERIRALRGRLWVVEKGGVKAVNDHPSEGYAQWVGEFPVVVIANDSTLEDLALAVPEILRYERLRESAAPLVRYSARHVAECVRKEAA